METTIKLVCSKLPHSHGPSRFTVVRMRVLGSGMRVYRETMVEAMS